MKIERKIPVRIVKTNNWLVWNLKTLMRKWKVQVNRSKILRWTFTAQMINHE